MKANELMIGDYVGFLPTWKNEDGTIHRDGNPNNPIICNVEMLVGSSAQLDNGEDCFDADDIELYPILLTPEILENNFEKKTFYGIYDDYFDLDIREYSDCLYIVTYHSCEFNIPDQTIHLSWVHELQHFIRYCGIEKEIEL